MLRIAWKPRINSIRSAGTRIRCVAPMSFLASHGYETAFFKMPRRDRYDVVVYSKLYDDSSFLEASALKKHGTKVVFDLFDNHFYISETRPRKNNTQVQICRMMDLADAVVASTDTLASVMRDKCGYGKPIHVIGDSVETSDDLAAATYAWQRAWIGRRARILTDQIRAERDAGIFPLVWFGIHGGPHAEHGMGDLEKIKDILEEVNSQRPLSLTVISNSRRKYKQIFEDWQLRSRYLEWNGYGLMDVLRSHSLAVIPLTRNSFTECKSSNRLAQALFSGLGVIADSIPSYLPFKSVCRLDNWRDGLYEYISRPENLGADVARGQQLVLACCTKTVIGDQWRRLIADLTT